MKFFIGDEFSGLSYDKFIWITKTFPKENYKIVDEGYFHYDKYVIFNEEKDALLFKLRWS